jgi:hypothetical protein
MKHNPRSCSGAWDAALSALEQNQRLEITPRANQAGDRYNGYVSGAIRNLTGASASVEVVRIAGGSAATALALCLERQNFHLIETGSGSLYFTQVIAGARTETTVAYNAAQHRCWRIRHDAATNMIAFETSADRVTWTARRTVPRQMAITALRVEISAGSWERISAPGTAIFDNFRLEGN